MKKNILLIIIFISAFLLRIIGVGQNPPSLTWDEVAWGYNAYSIGIDGRDEFGKWMPIEYLESFGDFKPTLYVYLSILPVKIFGLNEFATRLPSVVFGTLTVVLTYFLVKEIFRRRDDSLAIISTFILAISPWHIFLSRAAFEANVATFFVILGVYLFFVAVRINLWYLIPSVISFVLSMYTFNSARLVAPIIFIILFISHFKKMFNNKIQVATAGISGFLIFLPLLFFLLTPQASLRFNEVNIFSDISIIERANQQIENDNGAFWSKIIHNRRFAYGVEYLRHYFDNLSPDFLFIKGDGNPKFSLQDVGQLYLWEIPFLFIGILFLFRNREKNWWIVPVIFVLGIFPAGFARETPHALRIENSIPAFQILTAYGMLTVLSNISQTYKNINLKKSFVFVMGVLILLNFMYFLHNYINHYPREFSGEWQYGYKEAVNFISLNKNKYKKIYITESLGRPYIYFLFYEKYPPEKFRKEATVVRETLGFVHVKSFDNYEFLKTPSEKFDEGGEVLFLTTPGEVPDNAFVVREFKLLNNKTSLVAFTL